METAHPMSLPSKVCRTLVRLPDQEGQKHPARWQVDSSVIPNCSDEGVAEGGRKKPHPTESSVELVSLDAAVSREPIWV